MDGTGGGGGGGDTRTLSGTHETFCGGVTSSLPQPGGSGVVIVRYAVDGLVHVTAVDANPSSLEVGQSTTITVSVVNIDGAASGTEVTLEPSADLTSSNPVTTDDNGHAEFTVSHEATETVTYTAMIDGASTSTAEVTYQAGPDPAAGTLITQESFDQSLPGIDSGWQFAGSASPTYPSIQDGRLRIVPALGDQNGSAIYDVAQPTSAGLDVTFRSRQFGGSGADGIAFFLVDGDTSGISPGASGGRLGYVGLSGSGGGGALLGIGLDTFGNFSTEDTAGCSPAYVKVPSALTIRGGAADEWCVLSDPQSIVAGWSTARQIRIEVDPASAADPQVRVSVDGTLRSTFPQPAALQSVDSFKFGFTASTGGSDNNHDIWDVEVRSLIALPPVAWSTVSPLPSAVFGQPYEVHLDVDNAVAPATVSVDGALPGGLTIDGLSITGMPTQAGEFTFALEVADSRQAPSTATREFTLTVDAVVPTVVTTGVSPTFETPATSVDATGEVSDAGSNPVTERGFVYDLAGSGDPTYENNTGRVVATDTDFTARIDGLVPNTTYRVRAYAINADGTGYGDTIEVTTQPLPLTLTAVTVDDRAYDGTTATSVTDHQLDGVVEGYSDVQADIEAAFVDADAGQRTVDVTDAALTGADVDRYALTIDPGLTGTATITSRTLSLSGQRDYDGTRAFDASTLDIAGLVDGEAIELSGQGHAASPAVGTHDLGVSGVSLVDGVGGLASNYTLDGGTHSVTIGERPLVGTFAAADKDYDGTTTATVTARSLGGLDPGAGVLPGDDVTLLGGTATFATQPVGAGITVTLDDAVLGGADADNYTLDHVTTTTATILPRTVTIGGSFAVDERVYDGTTTAAVADQGGLTVVGAVDDDAVSIDGVAAAFAAADTGADIPVSLTQVTLTGDDADQYAVSLAGAPTTTATITPRPATLSGDFEVADRVYDGTTAAEVVAATLTVESVLGDDEVTVTPRAAFAQRQVGDDIEVVLTEASTLAGAAADNYLLDLIGAPTTTAAITPRTAMVTGLTAVDRVYDGSTEVTLLRTGLAGIVAGDAVGLSGSSRGVAASAGVGEHRVTTSMSLTGADAGNYRLSVPGVRVTITPRPVRVADLEVATKVYDGTDAAMLYGGSLLGVAPSDTVELDGMSTARFASADAGTHPVTVALVLTGPAAADHVLDVPELSGTIVPAPASLRFVGGLSWVEGTTGTPRVASEPLGLSGVAVAYAAGAAPTTAGSYRVTASLEHRNYDAADVTAWVTVIARPDDDRIEGEPDIGPVLDEDGSGTPQPPALDPAGVRVTESGDDVDVEVRRGDDGGVGVAGGGFDVSLQARARDGGPMPVDAGGSLRMQQGGLAVASGRGFAPGSRAEVWLFSEPRFLGTVAVAADGTFTGSFPVPASIEVGVHTLQLNAWATDGQLRSVSLGLVVDPAPAAGGGVGSGADDGGSDGVGSGDVGSDGTPSDGANAVRPVTPPSDPGSGQTVAVGPDTPAASGSDAVADDDSSDRSPGAGPGPDDLVDDGDVAADGSAAGAAAADEPSTDDRADDDPAIGDSAADGPIAASNDGSGLVDVSDWIPWVALTLLAAVAAWWWLFLRRRRNDGRATT